MKLTEQKLREIIREELNSLNEGSAYDFKYISGDLDNATIKVNGKTIKDVEFEDLDFRDDYGQDWYGYTLTKNIGNLKKGQTIEIGHYYNDDETVWDTPVVNN
tara:strand:+ start:190 stop:498 length:309 start_codon:yes stop_codon:yes gene_type:complete